MAIRVKGTKYYVSFRWKQHRMDTVTSATSMAEAKRIEKAVKNAFKIYRFDHLDPASLEVVMKVFENKGWALPPELAVTQPELEITLVMAIEDYLNADERNRKKRNRYAIDRLVGHFGETFPVKDIKVPHIRRYQIVRQESVENGTVNRELSVMSSILRVQVELETIDFNPCMMVKRLPENQRDSYLSWEDFTCLLEKSWWLHDLIVMLYYTGMRFNEVVSARWEMFKPERRMLILPPDVTKEGKSQKKVKLRPKRIPLRKEAFELLQALRAGEGDNVIRATGPVLTYTGRYKNHCGAHQGKPIEHGMIRKAWHLATEGAGLKGLQVKDLRHTWKTNAQRSGMDSVVRNAVVGHSSNRSVEDRYIRLSDEVLLNAVDAMTFDHGWTELDMVEEG
jgi:integrase